MCGEEEAVELGKQIVHMPGVILWATRDYSAQAGAIPICHDHLLLALGHHLDPVLGRFELRELVGGDSHLRGVGPGHLRGIQGKGDGQARSQGTRKSLFGDTNSRATT